MEDFMQIAKRNGQQAWQIIDELHLEDIWKTAGAVVHLVGSLRMGLLMKHRDIDFHIYSDALDPERSFAAMAQLAANPAIGHIEYRNLINSAEQCIEWHAAYRDKEQNVWQIDMVHILRGSRYDGYFEKMADRIAAALTPDKKKTILQLKYETPDTEKIMGIEYYQAVIRDGVSTYAQFVEWRKKHPVSGIIEWMP